MASSPFQTILLLLLLNYILTSTNAFQPAIHTTHSLNLNCKSSHLFSSLPSTPQQQQTYSAISPNHPLSQLVQCTTRACEPRRLDTTADAHEAFRYEWGTWCEDAKLEDIKCALGDVRLKDGWEAILDEELATKFVGEMATAAGGEKGAREGGRRIRIAGGKYWDVILHWLPKNA
jgi:hypothetical protein